jgi:hypothetical protein
MIPPEMAAIAERMARIERKLDALLAALSDEQEPKQNALATLDDGTLDLDSDWSQTL